MLTERAELAFEVQLYSDDMAKVVLLSFQGRKKPITIPVETSRGSEVCFIKAKCCILFGVGKAVRA